MPDWIDDAVERRIDVVFLLLFFHLSFLCFNPSTFRSSLSHFLHFPRFYGAIPQLLSVNTLHVLNNVCY
ncbi:hypothetical protein BDQ17DRAFT_1285977 [Cyathus striatus]|nr:hypothetical protein BDQ17DRAFT_1285977 [Cyathus striatus]